MNPSDAAVLYALSLQHDGRFDDAVEFIMDYIHPEPMRVAHPSLMWWATTYAKQIMVYAASERYAKWRKK